MEVKRNILYIRGSFIFIFPPSENIFTISRISFCVVSLGFIVLRVDVLVLDSVGPTNVNL